MPRFKPIRQLRISEEVAEQLKQTIISGHFKPGEKLPSERDLAEEFQVSRVAIREAIRKLEHAGFMVTRQGTTGGAYVIDLTFEYLTNAFLDLFLADKISIPEMYQVRLLIEPDIARLATLHITPEYAQLLKEALEVEELPVASLPVDVDRKQRVHFILAEMCGNRFFEALMKSLLRLTKEVVEAVNPDPDYVHPKGMHRSVVEAVVAGNAEAAAEAMKKHTIDFGENFIKMERTYREKNSKSAF
ncbi:MAG: GntR family transcriptional regulator [Thermodesulfobacteriota bacterium]|jgi:DNA-binding FadR family transcriptional regulator